MSLAKNLRTFRHSWEIKRDQKEIVLIFFSQNWGPQIQHPFKYTNLPRILPRRRLTLIALDRVIRAAPSQLPHITCVSVHFGYWWHYPSLNRAMRDPGRSPRKAYVVISNEKQIRGIQPNPTTTLEGLETTSIITEELWQHISKMPSKSFKDIISAIQKNCKNSTKHSHAS